MKTIGQVIEQIFFDSGLSMREFSSLVGYSRQYLYDLFRDKDKDGTTRRLQLDTLKQICDKTHYDLGKLLAETGYITLPVTNLENNLTDYQNEIMNIVKQLNNEYTIQALIYLKSLLQYQNKGIN